MSERILRVLVADDELMARKRLRRILAAMPDVQVVAECQDAEETLAQLDALDVDVALLDIHMPGRSGLEVSQVAAEWGVEVVFTTAHPEHAVAAFAHGVADYVLKPIEETRLAVALSRVRQRLAAVESGPESPGPVAPQLARLALTVRGEVRLVDPAAISHAELDGSLVTVWVGTEALLTDLSIHELERRLPSDVFARVHRRALINLAQVERLKPQPSGGYLAITTSGHEVPVSRQAARLLRRRLAIG
jgi:two-component system LytT family response regulator